LNYGGSSIIYCGSKSAHPVVVEAEGLAAATEQRHDLHDQLSKEYVDKGVDDVGG